MRITILLLGLCHIVSGLPQAKRDGTCSVTQWKAWQDLTSTERSDYINATLCLMTTPGKAGIPGAQSIWDELQYAHIANSNYIHFVGAFLPWHRYYLKVHQTLLRNECGYKGAMPYWNEVIDVKNFTSSAIFDPRTGFGGDGAGPARCVADGPFANLTLRFRADLGPAQYCLIRILNRCPFTGGSQANLDECLGKTTYEDAWHCMEALPHSAGHAGVGGVMVNLQLSPGDPIFFLHHAYLDRLWWRWQSRDLPSRVQAVGGPNVPASLFPFGPGTNRTFPPPGLDPECFKDLLGSARPNGASSGTNALDGPPPASAFPGIVPNTAITRYFNDGGGNATTLNHTLWSAGIMPNATIGDVMDIRGSYVCAEYL